MQRPTRAQRRRVQRAAEDAEREERIAAEDAERGESERELEEQKVVERLTAEGLMVHQVQVGFKRGTYVAVNPAATLRDLNLCGCREVVRSSNWIVSAHCPIM